MKKDTIEELFKNLEGSFDVNEPSRGHQDRFLDKLKKEKTRNRERKWTWKPLAIAASLLLFCALAYQFFGNGNSTTIITEEFAILPEEVSETKFYFASLVEEQVNLLKDQNSPETKQIIDDTLLQLDKLEENYQKLEETLTDGGDTKIILRAMITNFQTRIDLLTEVMNQIENIKSLKNLNDENFTI